MLPEGDDKDRALRQVMRLYRYDWPVLVHVDVPRALALRAPALVIVARGGRSNVVVKPPFRQMLEPVL